MNHQHGVKSSKACFPGSRFCIGIVLLLIVDVIWVASSELSKHFFFDIRHEKPYLSAYVSLSMLSIYLFGFVVVRSWRKRCIRCACDDYPGQYLMIGETDTEDTDDGIDYQLQNKLSEPMYVPVKFSSDMESSDGERKKKSHRVKFSDLTEVRHLEESSAAQLARMPYLAALKAKFILQTRNGNLTVSQIARLSCFFALVIFAGSVAYLEALSMTSTVAVNILSSTSSLFTLILAAVIPSDERDHVTIGKLLAVISCIGGIVLVGVSNGEDLNFVDFGSVWTLVSALCCAAYVVLLRRIAGDSLNVPMFFAFVGLFTFLLLWPGLVVLHYTNVEQFELPDKKTVIYLAINGLIGTVVSEVLYLWGCLLTTSLVGSLSISLTVPISVATDLAMRQKYFSWRFFTGALPVFGSFIFVAITSSTDDSMLCSRCCEKRSKHLFEQEIPLTRLSSSES